MENNEEGKWIEIDGKVKYVKNNISNDDKEEIKMVTKILITTTLIGITAAIALAANTDKIYELVKENSPKIYSILYNNDDEENEIIHERSK